LETRSRLTLGGPSSVGAYRYAEDPSTHVHCVAWALRTDHGVLTDVHLWKQGDDLLGEASIVNDWLAHVRDPEVVLVAHNVEFEKSILREKFGLDIPVERWDDTAARSARMSLPRALEDACPALGLEAVKDVEGSRVMLKLAKPRKISKENRDEFWSSASKPEDFERLYEYCKDDVRAMIALDEALPPLSSEERAIWELTIRMNERGVKLDVPSILLAKKISDDETALLAERFKALTGFSPGQVAKAATFLGLGSLDKQAVRNALKDEPAGTPRREALELRKKVGRSSLKKLDAFLRVALKDGRARGSLVYAGAERTLRWSGSGFQPQNIPKGIGEALFEAFESLRLGLFHESYEEPLRVLTEILRGFLVGPFLVGDFAQIEARVLAWLAGQADLIATFAANGDPYSEMAAAIFGYPVTKKTVDPTLPEGVTPRFIGKTVVLGAGYGLGSAKFLTQLDKQFDVQIDEALADRCIRTFRRRYTAIPKLWETLERGFKFVLRNQSKKVKVGPVFMGMTEDGSNAFIELPSGRKMFYRNAHLDADGEIRYFGRNLYAGGRWEEVATYGGKTTENVVQAVSRDLLAAAMLRLDAAGFRLVLTVHDEVVSEDGPERLKEFERLLLVAPPWAAGLPLGVECFATERYRK
jgi:DNA polymerase